MKSLMASPCKTQVLSTSLSKMDGLQYIMILVACYLDPDNFVLEFGKGLLEFERRRVAEI
jgi:hypothetical protein